MDGSEETVTVDQIDGVDLSSNVWDTAKNPVKPELKDGPTTFGQVSTDSSRNSMYEGVALYKVDTRDNGLVKLEGISDNGSEYVGVANDKTLTTDKRQFQDAASLPSPLTPRSWCVAAKLATIPTLPTPLKPLPEYVEGTVDLYYTYYINNGNNIVDRVM
mgnify:CR=1 FL=1